ncbi:TRADD-N-associated membrane domain-containing protein [Scytonema sp. PCC 10023]|uniref:TRADD-N-associated membrane domain-containing protein n=1 Tax=Scytonema sp. PCC 10023 TaxID=1680591 RepID=UPI0039C5FC92
MFNIFKKHQNNEQPNSNQAENKIEQKIIEELLRQARLTFNLALGVTAASAMMTLSGVALLYLNKVPEASLTAGAGILASISSVKFAKDAKEELGEMIDNLPK